MSVFKHFSFWFLILAAIWVPVVYLLGAQWSVYEQYQYGWAVPFLCAYLFWKKAETLKTENLKSDKQSLDISASQRSALVLLIAFGLGYWLMRVVQEADPIWRLASYGLDSSAVVMTLTAIYLTQGAAHTRYFAFPVILFLVAVPWPSGVENLVIQNLTRLNSAVVVEILNFVGIPALLHGNVIEVSTGLVGIDEACSGIRSLQATLMIALFFGEFYRLRWSRRIGLLLAGPVLALGFNLMRTLILVMVAARQGLPEMQRWHDSTGVALLVGCFICLWGVAAGMGKWKKKAETLKAETISDSKRVSILEFEKISACQYVSVSKLSLCLLVWAVLVEVSTEAWFRSHEMRGGKLLAWTARWPAANPTLQTNTIPENAQRLLQCDQNASANWIGTDEVFWQAFFLHWNPANSFYGRVKVALSKSHNPAICLTAAGMKLERQLDAAQLPVLPGFSLWFDRYVFSVDGQEIYVFFSQTEDMKGGVQASQRMTVATRLQAVLAGSRNYGQNNFEVALTGPGSAAEALQIFSARLRDLIEADPENMMMR